MFNEKRGDRRNAPNLMLVMTDGVSTVDANITCDTARNARYKADINIQFIHISQQTFIILWEAFGQPLGTR